MKRKRPLFVTLLSPFLIFTGGVTSLVLLFNGPISVESDLSSQCGVTGAVWRQFGLPGLRAELAPLSLLMAITGIGLWRMLPWARTVILLVSCVEMGSATEQLIEMRLKHSCSYIDLTSAFFSALLLLYFSRKKIKHMFRPDLADATPAV